MSKPLFGVTNKSLSSKYSHKVATPQYLPSDRKPDLGELVDYTKYAKLVKEIRDSNVGDDEKKFLVTAASRHIVFNYAKIADYYAHATPEMQNLMEKSALVIIDFNDAIMNGYVELSKEISQIVRAANDEK